MNDAAKGPTISSAGEIVKARTWVKALAIYLVSLGVGIGVFLATPKRSVSHHYEQAAIRWLSGESLYRDSKESGHGFLYLPQAAILHIPFAICSKVSGVEWFGDTAWRITSWLALVVGCWHFRKLIDVPLDHNWVMASCVSVLGISCLRIGQSTILLTALMILALVAWRMERFTQSAICLALALAIKPLAIVLVLLVFAISGPMRLRLILSLMVLALFPFACQTPSYVFQQYMDAKAMLQTAAELGNSGDWAQLFGMLDFFGIAANSQTQSFFRVVAALGTLALAFHTIRILSPDRRAIWIFTWTAIYLLLFNPRTENSTYCLVGPVMGIFVTESFVRRERLATTTLIVLAVLIAGSYEIGKHFSPPGVRANWLAPLACCVLLVYLLIQFRRETQIASTTSLQFV